MAATEFNYTDEDTGTRFEWEGGEYIDAFVVGEEYPFETINVRDYSEGADTDDVEIEKTQAAFEEYCREWIKEN